MSESQHQVVLEAHHAVRRILRMKEVISRTGLSRGGIYARMSRDEFPASLALGGRAVGWLESDIDAWINERVIASREATN